MPWHADYARNGAMIWYSGLVTGAEIAAAKAEFFAHRFPEEAAYVLCDFSAVRTFEVAPDDVTRVVEQDRSALSSHPDLLEAVVAPTPLQYGLSRMWQERVDDVRPHTAVLRTRSEAVHWLATNGVDLSPDRHPQPDADDAK